MDTVILDGVEYVRAAVAATKFKYTTDYIGQLCRGKKVDARLVGRSWYVNIASIKDYRSGRHKHSSAETMSRITEIKPTTSTESHLAIREVDDFDRPKSKQEKVAARLKTSTLKQLADVKRAGSVDGKKTLYVSYEPDDGHLMPTITKKQVIEPQYVPVVPAEAAKVSIKLEGGQAAFAPTDIPDFALSGKLAITDYPDLPSVESGTDGSEPESVEMIAPEVNEDTEIDNNLAKNEQNDLKNKDITDISSHKTNAVHVKVHAAKSDAHRIVHVSTAKSNVTPGNNGGILPQNLPIATEAQAKMLSRIVKRDVEQVSFVPSSIAAEVTPVVGMSAWVRFSPALATFFAVGCVALVFLTASFVTVSKDSYRSEVVLQTANLVDIFLAN